jgi:hypothetical protein
VRTMLNPRMTTSDAPSTTQSETPKRRSRRKRLTRSSIGWNAHVPTFVGSRHRFVPRTRSRRARCDRTIGRFGARRFESDDWRALLRSEIASASRPTCVILRARKSTRPHRRRHGDLATEGNDSRVGRVWTLRVWLSKTTRNYGVTVGHGRRDPPGHRSVRRS